jgi:hypothetical protein
MVAYAGETSIQASSVTQRLCDYWMQLLAFEAFSDSPPDRTRLRSVDDICGADVNDNLLWMNNDLWGLSTLHATLKGAAYALKLNRLGKPTMEILDRLNALANSSTQEQSGR